MLNDFGRIIKSRITAEECQKVAINQLLLPCSKISQMEINNQAVFLTKTKCNYGGDRNWFICPACKKRVGTLYRKPLSAFFLCRGCQNLTYQLRKYHRSQQEMLLKQLKSINVAI